MQWISEAPHLAEQVQVQLWPQWLRPLDSNSSGGSLLSSRCSPHPLATHTSLFVFLPSGSPPPILSRVDGAPPHLLHSFQMNQSLSAQRRRSSHRFDRWRRFGEVLLLLLVRRKAAPQKKLHCPSGRAMDDDGEQRVTHNHPQKARLLFFIRL